MKFSVITIFPKLIESYISESIIKRAVEKEIISIEILDLRDYSNYKHNKVDDYQFGGSTGMLLMVEPIVSAIESIKTSESLVVLTSPQGKVWNQAMSQEWSKKYSHIIIICGHYEGFDERILDYVDCEISIGDYVITGGELSSLVILDSITRLIPNVIKEESHQNDSFVNGLLDYSSYTKPVDFRGKIVPEVLLSGHHKNIEDFRLESSLKNTYNKRPDLLEKIKLNDKSQKILNKIKERGK